MSNVLFRQFTKKAFCFLLFLLIFEKSFSQFSDWDIVPVSFKKAHEPKGAIKTQTKYDYEHDDKTDSLVLLYKETSHYNRQGNATNYSFYSFANNQIWHSYVCNTIYDEKGNLIEQVSYSLAYETIRDTSVYFYFYDDDGYLVKDSVFSDDYHGKSLYEYDAQKKLLKGEEWDYKHNAFNANYFQYDSLGRLCMGEAYEDSVLTQKTIYAYDSNNNLRGIFL